MATRRTIAIGLWLLSSVAAFSTQAAPQPIIQSRMVRDFARLSFQWPNEVRFRAESSGNSIRLVFEQPVAVQTPDILRQLQPYIIGASQSNDGKVLTLTTNKPYKTRSFLSGTTTGIDLLNVDAAQARPEAVVQAEPRARPPEPAKVTAAAAPLPEPPKPALPQRRRITSLPVAKPQPPQAEVIQEAAAPAAATTSAPEAEVVASPVVTPDATPTPQVPPSSPAETVEADTVTAPTTLPSAADKPPATVQAPPTPAVAAVQSDALVLSFSLPKTAKLAAFRRAGQTWLLFDQPNALSHLSGGTKAVQDYSQKAFSLLAVDTDLPGLTTASADGKQWQLTLSSSPATAPQVPLAMDDGQLATSAGMFGPPLTFTDPIVGDSLIAVPAPAAAGANSTERDYIDLTLLPTLHGLLVKPEADGVDVSIEKNMLSIGKKGGLALSAAAVTALQAEASQTETQVVDAPVPPPVAAPASAEPPAAPAATPAEEESAIFFPYEQWLPPKGTTATDYEQQLIAQAAAGLGEARQAMHRKLAQLYLVTGRPYEAQAMVELIRSTDPNYFNSHKLRSLLGGAAFLAYRFDLAMLNFSHDSLKDDTEAQMWRTALGVLLNDEDTGDFDYLGNLRNTIAFYPPEMRQRLALVAANQLIGQRHFNAANKVLDSLKDEKLPAAISSQVDFLRGKIFADSSQTDQARALWKKLAEGSDAFIAPRAAFALTNLDLQKGTISLAEAIKQLEPLRVRWRGDSLETNVLQLIAQMYEQTDDFANALRAYRDLTTNFPELPNGAENTERMSKMFIQLFNEGGADKMAPLDALTLFYEFRELTPIEEEGDQMIRNLADRLIKVDLLDRGAALLQHQVQYRLSGSKRSKVGAQLALVYLLNRQPQQALDVLELTGYGKNTDELQQTRKLLTARALADLKEPGRAIALLDDDDGIPAEELKLSIHWENKNWPEVIRYAEDLLSRRPDPSKPISEDEADILNKLGIAYIFERQTEQLNYLRDYFLPLMPASSDKEIFNFITDDTQVDYKNLARLTAHLDKVSTFLAKYQKELKEKRLSDVIP